MTAPPLAKSVALVTNGTSRLGAEIARHLSAAGATVALGEAPEETSDPETVVPGATVHRGWLSSPADCERVAAEVVDAHGRLDIVVCVTGRRGFNTEVTLDRLDTGAWDRGLAGLLSGPFYMLRAALPGMLAQGHGRIVTVIPVDGAPGSVGQGLQAVASAGLLALTERMAREVAGSGVTVNAVTCGLMESELMPDEVQARARAAVPAGRLGRPSDVARAVTFLCEPENEYVTGQVLGVDGGLRA